MRAAANQFGHLRGAAEGGLTIALAGFRGVGIVLATIFVAALLVHAPPLLPTAAGVALQAAG